jgi:hypothetical protein
MWGFDRVCGAWVGEQCEEKFEIRKTKYKTNLKYEI